MRPPDGAGVSPGIKHPHMAGAVLEHHRVVRRGGVEQDPVGVALFPQRVMVVALGDDPRARLRTLGADVLPQPAGDFLQVGAFIQRHLEQGVGRGGKVTVRVDEGGQQGVPLQIHPPRPGPGQLAGFLPRPRQDDPAPSSRVSTAPFSNKVSIRILPSAFVSQFQCVQSPE